MFIDKISEFILDLILPIIRKYRTPIENLNYTKVEQEKIDKEEEKRKFEQELENERNAETYNSVTDEEINRFSYVNLEYPKTKEDDIREFFGIYHRSVM